jgi:hypothetical protein
MDTSQIAAKPLTTLNFGSSLIISGQRVANWLRNLCMADGISSTEYDVTEWETDHEHFQRMEAWGEVKKILRRLQNERKQQGERR